MFRLVTLCEIVLCFGTEKFTFCFICIKIRYINIVDLRVRKHLNQEEDKLIIKIEGIQ